MGVSPLPLLEFFLNEKIYRPPEVFSRVDVVALVLVLLGAVSWIAEPESLWTGVMLIISGVASLVRLLRWRGWLTWQEPLVLILHVGYGWIGLFLLALGTSILGIGFSPENAVHLLTTGAMGTMTLAVMTRASLGHTGRPRHADQLTVAIYILINVGALLRIFALNSATPATLTYAMLGLSALGWSGAYLLFAFHYGPYLVRPSLDE